MNALITKTRTASTETIKDMAIILADATNIEARMSRMAVMVVLEERLGAVGFNDFCNKLEVA